MEWLPSYKVYILICHFIGYILYAKVDTRLCYFLQNVVKSSFCHKHKLTVKRMCAERLIKFCPFTLMRVCKFNNNDGFKAPSQQR
jgi:hypothetical protein